MNNTGRIYLISYHIYLIFPKKPNQSQWENPHCHVMAWWLCRQVAWVQSWLSFQPGCNRHLHFHIKERSWHHKPHKTTDGLFFPAEVPCQQPHCSAEGDLEGDGHMSMAFVLFPNELCWMNFSFCAGGALSQLQQADLSLQAEEWDTEGEGRSCSLSTLQSRLGS